MFGSIGASATKLDPGAPPATSNVGLGAASNLHVWAKERGFGMAFAATLALRSSDRVDMVKGLTAHDLNRAGAEVWVGGRGQSYAVK